MKSDSPTNTPEATPHADVIETMRQMGFGLLNNGQTFYQLGYELNPRLGCTFNMTQAYYIHNSLTQDRTRLLEQVLEVQPKLSDLPDYKNQPNHADKWEGFADGVNAYKANITNLLTVEEQ